MAQRMTAVLAGPLTITLERRSPHGRLNWLRSSALPSAVVSSKPAVAAEGPLPALAGTAPGTVQRHTHPRPPLAPGRRVSFGCRRRCCSQGSGHVPWRGDGRGSFPTPRTWCGLTQADALTGVAPYSDKDRSAHSWRMSARWRRMSRMIVRCSSRSTGALSRPSYACSDSGRGWNHSGV